MVRLLAGSIAAGFLGLSACPLQAGRVSQAFLDGLRKREFYDTALDYLEAMRTSPLADKAFLEVIDYEMGVTLVASARSLPLVDREKRLNEARNAFREVHRRPSAAFAGASARNAHLGNLLVERGRVKME